MNTVFPSYRFFVQVMESGSETSLRAQDISGLKMQLSLAKLEGAGDSQYVPDEIKYEKLIVRRALMYGDSNELIGNIEPMLQQLQIKRMNLAVHLLGLDENYAYSWSVLGAYVVEWEVSGFNANSNDVLIEQIAFQYDELRRI